jgi:hypothetical protein
VKKKKNESRKKSSPFAALCASRFRLSSSTACVGKIIRISRTRFFKREAKKAKTQEEEVSTRENPIFTSRVENPSIHFPAELPEN